MSDFIETNTNDDGIDRRGFLSNVWPGPALASFGPLTEDS
jgi:hypothetical protein